MSDYIVIYEQAEDGGWGAYLPDFPGVVAIGATRSEVVERIEEALAAYADDLTRRGGSLPAPHHTAGTIRLPDDQEFTDAAAAALARGH